VQAPRNPTQLVPLLVISNSPNNRTPSGKLSGPSGDDGIGTARVESRFPGRGIMSSYEIQDGFILKAGRLRQVTGRELAAATHLIGGFRIGMTQDHLTAGTLVWFRGNTRGFKVSGGVELGPESLGTQPGGFWSHLEDDLKQSMRIDRQKYFSENDRRYCDYHLQVGSESIACILVPVSIYFGERLMRRAFNLSLKEAKNVTIAPTDPRKG
jgi:hypothetical protein